MRLEQLEGSLLQAEQRNSTLQAEIAKNAVPMKKSGLVQPLEGEERQRREI